MAGRRKRTRQRPAAARTVGVAAAAAPVTPSRRGRQGALGNAPPFRARAARRAGLVGALAFVVYALTVEPGVPTGDSGELISSAYVLGCPAPAGLPALHAARPPGDAAPGRVAGVADEPALGVLRRRCRRARVPRRLPAAHRPPGRRAGRREVVGALPRGSLRCAAPGVLDRSSGPTRSSQRCSPSTTCWRRCCS